MQINRIIVGASFLFTIGCTTPTIGSRDTMFEIGNVPDAVVSLAAPGQDLTSARLRPEDGCYWYEHNGRVETTVVPLRAIGGSQICTSRSSRLE